jgi:hypothetical protein
MRLYIHRYTGALTQLAGSTPPLIDSTQRRAKLLSLGARQII